MADGGVPVGPDAPYPVDDEGLPRRREDVYAWKSHNIARAFHEVYERLAPDHGYETRERSAVPWEDVPAENKALMLAVVRELLDRGVVG